MSISVLALSHFRSHRATRLQADGRLLALIGPNGAGKTNVLEAISLLSPGRGLRRAATDDLSRRPEMLGWKVSAQAFGMNAAHEIETFAQGAEARQVRLDGKPVPQVMLARVLRILWLVPTMDRLWIEPAEGRRRFLDRMVLSFFPDHAEAVLAYDKAMRDRNRLLKDDVADDRWYGALEQQMADAGARINANRRAALARLAAAQDGVETAFPRADLTLAHPEDWGDDLAHALARGRRRDQAAGRTLTGPHRADLAGVYAAKGVAADQCSTGEQKALLLSLVLANARALRDETGLAPLLLLDEVAAHLDAERRAALYDEITALGAQAFMTGTDAALFDTAGGRAQIMHVADEGGASQVKA